ncbi:MAG: PD-(D/E)XK nuclease-like domain-containing protein [Gammaproteobacteria bacterium]|nr:PD-(D/E)XK nuclease-like domain-containing protein [Gammaproteobacteria bacterium]
MQPGILHDITDEVYFADPSVSNSDLKLLGRSAAHFKYAKQHPKESTPDMLIGSSLHHAVLQPESFMDCHGIIPANAPARPTKPQLASKNPTELAMDRISFWEQFDMVNEGKLIITDDQAGEFLHIGGMIRNHPELSVYFDKGVAERAIFAVDPICGIPVKCKADWLTKVHSLKICLEMKSTKDARKGPFTRDAYKYGYFTAATFYQDVMEWSIGRPDLYLIVAFEKEPPYGVKIYEIPEGDIDRGRSKYGANLALYAHCVETDTWPNYDTTIETLSLPPWAKD